MANRYSWSLKTLLLFCLTAAFAMFIYRRDVFVFGSTYRVQNVVYDSILDVAIAYGMVGWDSEGHVEKPNFGYIVIESTEHKFDTSDKFRYEGKAIYFSGRKVELRDEHFTLAIKRDGRLVFFGRVADEKVEDVFKWEIMQTEEQYAFALWSIAEELENEGRYSYGPDEQ
ncbi:hypothetical protein [Crateriforma spongiae]|uniref:hypothetical protein n=1 Tax=Crateriforma spongiae TaxID=2724528 RepID=UPI001447AEF8|nr:hypothetical protein [Crateriforma spongiae]